MPIITVKTTITTTFDVPEGVGIELVRHQSFPTLNEDEEETEAVMSLQSKALNQVYLGDARGHSQSVSHSIIEGKG